MNNKLRDPKRYTLDNRKNKTYQSWCNMRNRCLNPKSTQHKWYKNIPICSEWDSYDVFYEDMGERPEGMTLDRKDSSLGYFKNNCKWSTSKEQIRNRSNVTLIEFHNEILSLSEVSRLLGFSSKTLSHRLNKQKLTLEEALHVN